MKISLGWILLSLTLLFANEINYREDNSAQRILHVKDARSHIKVFLPTQAYTYVSRLVNESLLRLADNEQGWEYALATSHRKISPLVYEFELRKNVLFQDGTPFNSDAVVHNFNAFLKEPFKYTNISNTLDSVEKVSSHTIRLRLKKPYGMFMRDLARIYIYSNTYLQKYGWNGGETGGNIKEAGLYGLGAYILKEGIATGKEQTPIVTLIANPLYWDKEFPYIQKITIYTQLKTEEALQKALYEDNGIDFMPIPFHQKLETILSPYTKLIKVSSSNSVTIHFNLNKRHSAIYQKEVRRAINCAIHQKNLLDFTYNKEGHLNPNALTPKECTYTQEELHSLLNNLHLKIATQDAFLFLWKGIEYQLSQYGVTLDYDITTSEREIFRLIQSNHIQAQEWDLLLHVTPDWYGSGHPWPIFSRYHEGNSFSFVHNDTVMKTLIQQFFATDEDAPSFSLICERIRERAREEAYMLYIPIPNVVFAMNKELVFDPLGIAMQPFWKANITSEHWSVRENRSYPKPLEQPILPQKIEHEKN